MMKNSTKIILSTVVVSILGFGSFTRATYANQLPYRLLATPQSTSGVQVAEVDSPHDRDSSHEDGDTEASDVRRAPITRAHRGNQVKYHKTHHRKYVHVRQHHTM